MGLTLPSGLSPWVYGAVASFGVSSWLCVLAVWLQLPLLVGQLPEGWALPSYLAVTVQLGQLGPVAFGLIRRFWPSTTARLEVGIIAALILASGVGLGVMTLSWWRTATVAGRSHSVGLFVPFLMVSMVDCTSTVAYLPFLYAFKPAYVGAFFVGMGLGGSIASLVALIQGGADDHCNYAANVTGLNDTVAIGLMTPSIRFGVSTFLGLNILLLLFSLLSFFALNWSRMAQREKVVPVQRESSGTADKTVESVAIRIRGKNKTLLLLLTAWICALQNGILPSCQTFALLPYGATAYHLAVVLGSLANPSGCFLPLCINLQSPAIFSVLTSLVSLFSAYLVAMGVLSPAPLLSSSIGGSFLMVSEPRSKTWSYYKTAIFRWLAGLSPWGFWPT